MGKIRLAVAGETRYAGRLADCIRKNAPEYLEVVSCCGIKELSEYLVKLQPDILVCETETTVNEDLQKYLVQIYLTTDRNYEKNKKQDESDVSYIFRYQSGSEIMRQIFRIYGQTARKSLVSRCKTVDLEMTAFYAPGGHELLLPFSMAYASMHGKSAKALYLNLSEFSGMKPLFKIKDGNDLSDLIFGIRQRKERFSLCLQSVLHYTEQFDYVLPPENPEDLYEIHEEDLDCLLTLLQEQTDYKKIIWCCGTLNRATGQIMECCGKIFCVVKENVFGKHRKTEFEWFLHKEVRQRMREKVKYVNPQMNSGGFVQGIDLLTQLQGGEFAKQVQALTEDGPNETA